MDMREIAVTFSTGSEVLAAYWGYLSHGGLVIRDEGLGLAEGEPVSVDVTIESSRSHYRLNGQVVRQKKGSRHAKAVIAFQPGEPHDLLLSAAWAEAHNVPARRFPRFRAELPLAIRVAGQQQPGRLLNISVGGCCVRTKVAASSLSVGDRIVVHIEPLVLPTYVRWARASEVGLEFDELGGDRAQVDRLVARFQPGR